MARPNASVEKFKKLTDELKAEVHALAANELLIQANALVDAMESVAPRGETGNLLHSITVVPDKSKDTVVRVVAGGRLTVRPGVSSKAYDYSRADEFGTVNMKARPFFFPTYKLRKKKMIASMKRKITKSIKQRSAE
jgi:HK97 gp10 family phage protein